MTSTYKDTEQIIHNIKKNNNGNKLELNKKNVLLCYKMIIKQKKFNNYLADCFIGIKNNNAKQQEKIIAKCYGSDLANSAEFNNLLNFYSFILNPKVDSYFYVDALDMHKHMMNNNLGHFLDDEKFNRIGYWRNLKKNLFWEKMK